MATLLIFMDALSYWFCRDNLFPFVDFRQQGHKTGQIVKRLNCLALIQAGSGIVLFEGFDKAIQNSNTVLCSRIEFADLLTVPIRWQGAGIKRKKGGTPILCA